MAIADHNNLQVNSLFNGNISSMEVNIAKLSQPLAYKYRYDQLNRLKQVRAFDGFNIYNNSWENMNPLAAYAENYQYDPNGNILTLKRNGSADLTDMDDFTYHYIAGTNKLDYVSDAVNADNYKIDIDNQPAGNYKYDEIGNLIKDVSGCIDSISWTVYGKVWKVYKCNKDSLIFAYDPMGGRVMKTYWNDSLHRKEQTIYVRDATGNEMAMYKLVNNDTLILSQQAIYGSSRLGVLERDEIVSIDSSLHPQNVVIPDPLTENVTHWIRGKKRYELTNHLGNVLATVNDRKLPVYANNNFSYYKAEVMTANDYYAFGAQMPKRGFDTSDYRFHYNTQERVPEVSPFHQTAPFWEYDPRAVLRWNTDPQYEAGVSPYVINVDNPIMYSDPEGDCATCPQENQPQEFLSGESRDNVELFSASMTSTIKSNLEGLKGAVANPTQTLSNVWQAVTNLPQTVSNAVGAVKEMYDDATSGDPKRQGEAAGNLVSGYVVGQVVGGALKGAGKTAVQTTSAESTATVAEKTGRAANKLKPDANAQGAHSTYKTNPNTGKTTNYATYEVNPKNPTGFQEVKRVDITGKPHGGIETPHVKEGGKVRSAEKVEIPNQ